jgi:hypothetical protein
VTRVFSHDQDALIQQLAELLSGGRVGEVAAEVELRRDGDGVLDSAFVVRLPSGVYRVEVELLFEGDGTQAASTRPPSGG